MDVINFYSLTHTTKYPATLLIIIIRGTVAIELIQLEDKWLSWQLRQTATFVEKDNNNCFRFNALAPWILCESYKLETMTTSETM